MSDGTELRLGVDTCLTQYYKGENGRWYWHCFAPCETGSDRHLRSHGGNTGHPRESDARYGAAQHAAQMLRNRRANVRYRGWRAAMTDAANAGDWAAFLAAWADNPHGITGPPNPRIDPAEIMAHWACPGPVCGHVHE